MSVEDKISNYYEHKVVEEIFRQAPDRNAEEMADIACVALNKLPSKYFRYEVDLAFYISTAEAAEMNERVQAAVTSAIQFVESHRRKGE